LNVILDSITSYFLKRGLKACTEKIAHK